MWITINSHALRRRPSAPPVHNIGNDKFPGYMVCARFRYAVVRVEHSAHYIPHIDHSTNPGTKNIAYNTATVHIHVVYDMCMCFHSRMGDRVWCWLVGVLCVCWHISFWHTIRGICVNCESRVSSCAKSLQNVYTLYEFPAVDSTSVLLLRQTPISVVFMTCSALRTHDQQNAIN